MISLTYTSRAIQPFSAEELVELLRRARERNAARSITGLLVYAPQSFIQQLEGEEDVIDELYARLQRDPRHSGLQIVDRARVEVRDHPEWAMGFALPDATRLAAVLPGYDPLASLARQTVVDGETARRLIEALAADAAEAAADPADG